MDALEINNAIMSGVSRYIEWRTKFLEQWNEALMLGQMNAMFAALPPEMKEMMKQTDPEMYKQLTSSFRKAR